MQRLGRQPCGSGPSAAQSVQLTVTAVRAAEPATDRPHSKLIRQSNQCEAPTCWDPSHFQKGAASCSHIGEKKTSQNLVVLEQQSSTASVCNMEWILLQSDLALKRKEKFTTIMWCLEVERHFSTKRNALPVRVESTSCGLPIG